MTEREKRRLVNILNGYSGKAMQPNPQDKDIYWYDLTMGICYGGTVITDNDAITKARTLILNSIALCQNEFPKHTKPLIDWIANTVEPRHLAQRTACIVDKITQAAQEHVRNAERLLVWIDNLQASPIYTHDCQACGYLGQYHHRGKYNDDTWYDLYFHDNKESPHPYVSIIARYGDQPEKYLSMPQHAIPPERAEQDTLDPLRYALDRYDAHVSARETGASIMGGPTKAEAREIIKRLTGKTPKE